MKNWYKLSLICGLIPLIAGCVIFALWLSTKSPWLMIAGIYNTTIGVALFIFGFIFLYVYGKEEKKAGKAYPKKQVLISSAILLLNLPVAASAVYSADYIMSASTVTVVNHSAFEVSNLILIEGDLSHPFPPVSPSQTIVEKFHFKYEGAVDYKLSLNGDMKEGMVFGYVSSGIGEHVTMIIKKDGDIAFERPVKEN